MKNSDNLLTFAALAIGGYFLYKKYGTPAPSTAAPGPAIPASAAVTSTPTNTFRALNPHGVVVSQPGQTWGFSGQPHYYTAVSIGTGEEFCETNDASGCLVLIPRGTVVKTTDGQQWTV